MAPSPERTPPRGRFSAGRARDGFVDYPLQTELPVATADQWHRGSPPSTLRSQRARAPRTDTSAPTSGSTVHSPPHRPRSVLSINSPLVASDVFSRLSLRTVWAISSSKSRQLVAQLKGGVYVTTIASRPSGTTCVYTTAISPRRSVV
jgi:hypothetical protein